MDIVCPFHAISSTVPNLARMTIRHDLASLPSPLRAEQRGEELRISLPEGPPVDYLLVDAPSLTRRAAENVVALLAQASRPVFVSYTKSTAEAREVLRAADVSFAGADGRVFVRAPGVLVAHDEPLRPPRSERWDGPPGTDSSARNPFAKRSSRVPRWLLLHPEQAFSLRELADATELNPAAVSRIVRTLHDATLVDAERADEGGRNREVRVRRPLELLEAWLPAWQRRRIRRSHWDVGARDAGEAISVVRESMRDRDGTWAIGGLVGAASTRRAVEPADTLVWTTAEEMATLTDVLHPLPARGTRGALHVAIAPDSWTLGLARSVRDLPIADPVQLWLDCSSEGERALEAAEAIAEAAGWM